MVLRESLYAVPPYVQDRKSPEPCKGFRASPPQRKSPIDNHTRSPRARRISQKISSRASQRNWSLWSKGSSWDPFASEDPEFASISISPKGPKPYHTSLPSKLAARSIGPERKSVTYSSIGPEKKSSVLLQSIGSEKISDVTDRQSRQSIFSSMTVGDVIKSAGKILEETEALRSETRQQLIDTYERKSRAKKLFEEELERANNALETKMSEVEERASEFSRQMTELELAKMDIDSACRERRKKARRNNQQLDWFQFRRLNGDDAGPIVDQLAAEQKEWQALSRELAESSRKTEVSLAELDKSKEKAHVELQIVKQKLLLNQELLREKPGVRRLEVPEPKVMQRAEVDLEDHGVDEKPESPPTEQTIDDHGVDKTHERPCATPSTEPPSRAESSLRAESVTPSVDPSSRAASAMGVRAESSMSFVNKAGPCKSPPLPEEAEEEEKRC